VRVVFRQRFLEEFVKNKTVLDLGSVEHDLYRDNIKKGKWLFASLQKNAKRIIGIDFLKEAIAELAAQGYDIRYGDVENLEQLELREEFDLIIAGELIEHLPNPGKFLRSISKFMAPKTELVLTTPNAFGFIRFTDALIRRERTRDDHMAYYSTQTLKQLLELHGYEVKEFLFYSFISGKRRSVFLSYIRKFWFSLFPYLSDGLIVIAKIRSPK
jgi:2-polyprenyl-3-methyl-5-hydroxy-6-metoxy-1,4-benzoquinol methylase